MLENLSHGEIEKLIEIRGDDPEMILVEWLSELLFFAEVNLLIFSEWDILDSGPPLLRAKVRGTRIERLEKSIKAVTYHDMEINKLQDGLTVTVVFDV